MSDPQIYATLAAYEKRLKALERQESGGLSGTWTPELQGSAMFGLFTYTRRVARYVQIGGMVFCSFEIIIATVTTPPTGNLLMTGVPFTAKNTTNYQQSGYLSQWDSLNYTTAFIPSLNISPNTTIVDFVQSGDNVASAAIPASTLVAGLFLRGSINYEVEG